MTGIKKYDIDGVGEKLQLGKHGPHLAASADGVSIVSKDGALAQVQAAPGSSPDDVATFAQLNTTFAALQTQASAQANALISANATIATLQAMLAKLMPSAPPSFPSEPLTVKGAAAFLAQGDVPNGTGQTIAPGTAVSRVAGAVISNTIRQNGPGDAGVLTLTVDGKTLQGYDFATKTPGDAGLIVSHVAPYPASTPGFWTSFDAQVKLTNTSVGIHELTLSHSSAGTTAPVIFVVDDLNEKPVLSGMSLHEASPGTLAYSSGVPHYSSDALLNVDFAMSNICGEAYEQTDPVVISASPDVMMKPSFSYTDLGFTVPLVRQSLSPTPVKTIPVHVDTPDYHGSIILNASASNVVGTSQTQVSPVKILVKQGSTGHIDEQAVAVKIRAGTTAHRVVFETETDTPSGSFSPFVSSAPLRSVDASVVAAVLSHDQTDYATGYLPVGPDLSTGRSEPQYATFGFSCGALSKFSIAVEGTYDQCWIKLPGVGEDTVVSPVSAAQNGWWNAFQSYNGAGAPGGPDDALNGCALGETMNGQSGSFTLTFGSATSSSAVDQTILVRFKLLPGQSISYLAFAN